MKPNVFALKPWALALLAGVFFASCKSQHYTPDTLPETQLVFGDGGGITGATTAYILLENGQIFKAYSLDNSMTEVGKIKKKQAQTLMTEARELGMEDMDVDQPGNMYYFLELKTDNGDYRCTWGAQGYEVNEQLRDFRQKLLNLARETAQSK